LQVNKKAGDQQGCARTYALLGKLALLEQNYSQAFSLYRESLRIAMKFSNHWHVASYMDGMAQVAVAQQEPAWAARLLGVAENLRQSIKTPLLPIEQVYHQRTVEFAQQGLGKESFAATWAEGGTMTPEQALMTQDRPPTATLKGANGLSKREIDVLRLLVQGKSNAQIAMELVLSITTVNSYLRSIYRKLDVSTRTQAMRIALDRHYI
jgi:DNA-binding CsgD family transcriptional regulator